MKNLIKKLVKEESNKLLLFEELSLLIEKELKVGTTLKKKLDNINKPFADKLLSYLNSDKIPDKVTIDYIDYTSDDDKTLTGYYEDREGNIKTRKFKVGKLLNYLGIGTNEFKGYELEELISHLKQGSTDDFKVVDGEDILKAYHCDNYDEGETMGSCMRYESAQSYLEIYVNNPDDVKCLVLFNPNNGKVRGRALLWHMDNDQWFMDRVYVTNNQYRNLFNLYKEEKNISSSANSTVTLENGGEYDEYPYMDTFEYYSPSNSELSTSADHEDSIKLQDTGGGYGPAGTMIDVGPSEGDVVDESEAYYVSYRTPNEYIEGFAHEDDIITIDGNVYLTDDCIKTYDGEWVFKYGDDAYVVELTAGRYEDEYAKLDDTVELEHNHYGEGQYITTEDNYEILDYDIYEIPYAFSDDTLETYNDKTILKSDAVKLYEPHYGDAAYAHPEDCTEVYIKDHGEVWVLDYDLDGFEEKEKERLNKNKDIDLEQLNKELENGLITKSEFEKLKQDKMKASVNENRTIIKKLLREGLLIVENKLYPNKLINQVMDKIGDSSEETKNKLSIAGLYRDSFGNIQQLKTKEQLDNVFDKWYENTINKMIKTSAFTDNKDLAKKYLDAYVKNVKSLGNNARPFSLKKIEKGLVDLVNNNNWIDDETISNTDKSIYKPDDKDIVYEDDEIIILDTNTKAKCVMYGRGESWCITKPELNYYNTYRIKYGATPYFVLQKNVEGDEHKLVIMHYPDGYAIADRSNSGDRAGGNQYDNEPWSYIENEIPNLKGLEEYFPYREITDDERKYEEIINKTKGYDGDNLQGYIDNTIKGLIINGSKVEAKDFIRDYAAEGVKIEDNQLKSLRPEVLDSLIESGYFLTKGKNQTNLLSPKQQLRVIRIKIQNNIDINGDELLLLSEKEIRLKLLKDNIKESLIGSMKNLIKKLLREGLESNTFESLLGEVTGKLDFSSFKMNDTLNPEIWVNENTINPEIQKTLIKIAKDYYNELGLDTPILDITLTGSLANYNWSKYSDVDLHIIFDVNELGEDKDMIKDLLDIKTRAWNLKHHITVKGFDVELYLQPEDQPHHSTGVYSLQNGEWVTEPTKVDVDLDKETITKKYNTILKSVGEIQKDMDEDKYEDVVKQLEKLKDKIKKMRQSGLDTGGEFSSENIVFKLLRRNDIMEKIDNMLTDAYDKSVTLDQ
jgi:hypothetical protein